jgi:hypothetical protein
MELIMKKKVYRQRKMQRIGNYTDGATSAPSFPKSPKKRTRGVAGKGGKTTNFGGGNNA